MAVIGYQESNWYTFSMAQYEARTIDDKCVFCEIVAGKLEAGIFWENDEFIAFLATYPSTEGFTCVIPKNHFGSDVLKLPSDVLQRFIVASKEAALVLENYYEDVGRVGVVMEGLGIDHAHIKLVPLHGTDYLKRGEWKQALSGKVFWFDKYEGWISSGDGPGVDVAKLVELANRIKSHESKK
ncbi:MAG: diadenosine tetraphosphate hydrolase [Candidatus Taylorbacteria bacterium]|nr:diadenosine tetraphosphate hydrolase [Candidatus Taylorbacteria bacterium]